MLITDPCELNQYRAEHRIWQGIPGVEVTRRGRIFVCFYSGGMKEEIGNYALLVMSDDGTRFTDPIAVAKSEGKRCFDPCLWIDPRGRLWFFWAESPENAVMAAVCEDPDAETPVFSAPRKIAEDVMMNKPIAAKDGRYLLPVAVWADDVKPNGYDYKEVKESGAFVVESRDEGETFEKSGKAVLPNRSFDEHMLIERADGSLRMYVRTRDGIGMADSFDGGKTFENGRDSGLGGPDSRFFIGRLRSGRLLLVNHVGYTKRDHLTALLSEDDGETWPYRLLIDARDKVSYPDAAQAEDGTICIVHDRDRGYYKKTLREMLESEREILISKIREEDILAGRLVSPESVCCGIVSKLTNPERG